MDLGFGDDYVEGWINADFFIGFRLKLWKRYNKRAVPDVELDLRYSLNCADSIVDGVYCGHTLEHLNPKHAHKLIKEIFRILKPGSWLRINVPDLEKFVGFYMNSIQGNEFKQFRNGCEAIFSLTQDYGHLSVWDYEALSTLLITCGFINVKKLYLHRKVLINV